MKKLSALFMALLLVMGLCSVMNSSAQDSEAEHWYISNETWTTVPTDAVFIVPTGKTVKGLSLNGKAVEQGDGVTPWISGFTSADKNWVYDSEKGTLTLSARCILSDLDLFDKNELTFVLSFTDGTSVNLKLNGKKKWFKLAGVIANMSSSLTDWSADNAVGYKNTEIKPLGTWLVTASSNIGSLPSKLFDSVKNEYHSYYKHDGSSFIYRFEAPHYIEVDMGENTSVSGVRYVPRSSNTSGSWVGVEYYGSSDGDAWKKIATGVYPGTHEESVTDFGKNVSYRYYRVKITASTSGYATGDELHFMKPKATYEDKTADLSTGSGASWTLSVTPGTVSEVYFDGARLDEESYSLSGAAFSLDEELVKTKALGEHTVKVIFDNSFMEVTLTIDDKAASLAAAKAAAKAELAVFGDLASSYTTEIDSKTTEEAVFECADKALSTLGAEIKALSYTASESYASPEIKTNYVTSDGKKLGDTSAIALSNGKVKATGLGRALILSGGKYTLIKTAPSPLMLVLISGQSNAAGDTSNYLEAPSATGDYEGRYYITNALNCDRELDKITFEDAVFAAKNGGRPDIGEDDYSWNRGGYLNSAAAASQLGARLSDEFDMPVWVVNTGICGQVIDQFDPTKSKTAYMKTVSYMEKVQKLIESNGHFIIDEDKTGMLWLQGESDGIGTTSEDSMVDYKKMFMNMYHGLETQCGVKYCGIWLVRAGVNSNVPKDFEMSGPRLAQVYMGNSSAEEYKNIYLVLNTDIWRTDEGVKAYFETRHPDAAAFKAYYGYDRPTTLSEIKPGLHHSQKGYNELGDVAGYLIKKILSGEKETVTDAYLADFYGNDAESISVNAGETTALVPMVTTPYYNANLNLTVKITDESKATYDPEAFAVKGISEGTTEAVLYYGTERLTSCTVTVNAPAVKDEVLADRTKWTVTASSVWTSAGRVAKNLTDSNTATSWTADINNKITDGNPQYFEIELPSATKVSGFSFNSYDDNNGFPLKYEIYIDSGSGAYEKVKEGTYVIGNFTKHAKYDIPFSYNYTAKKVKFVFLEGVSGYAAMSEAYLAEENSELSDYKAPTAKISITAAESGVYTDGTGIVRFITEIDELSGGEVEYYGSYAVETSSFNAESISLLNKVTVSDSGTAPKQGDTYALDVHNISEANMDKSITCISFVKLKGIDGVIYSEAKVNSGVQKSVKLGSNPYAKGNKIAITESNVKIHGRYIVDSETGLIKSSFSASGIEATFEGTKISVRFNADRDAYIYAWVDDNIQFSKSEDVDGRIFVSAGDNEIKIADNLAEGTHTVTVLKANEGADNVIAWESFVTDGTLGKAPSAKERKIQVVGDSITAGASTLHKGGYWKSDIQYNDGVRSYAPCIARALDADVEIFAQRGLSMTTSMSTNPLQYNRVNAFAASADTEFNYLWDHETFEPDLIIQCNWWNECYGKIDKKVEEKVEAGKTEDEAKKETAEEIKNVYVNAITMLKTAHPNAKIMLVSGTERQDFIDILNAAIQEYGKTNKADDITVMTYTHSSLANSLAAGTLYAHPNPEGHMDMAEQMLPKIKEFMGWD